MWQSAADFWRSKTTWTQFGLIVVAWIGYYQKLITIQQAVTATFAALSIMFMRDTVAKAGNIGVSPVKRD